jgi:hypothetical protein
MERIRLYPRRMKTNIMFLSRSASVCAARQLTPVLACWGALVLLAGCASEPVSHVISSPPPPVPTSPVVTTTTTTTPAAVAIPAVVDGNPATVTIATSPRVVSTTIVTEAPPAVRSDVPQAQPSPKDVWLAGYWTWRDAQYEWISAHWELPPNSRSVWVAPRWEPQGNAYKFTDGYWN